MQNDKVVVKFEKEIHKTIAHKTPNRLKIISTVFVCLSSISIYFITEDFTPYHIIAFILAIVFCHFYAILLYLLCNAKNLHRIIIRTDYQNGMGKIMYPFTIDSFPEQCIVSVGEFLATRGSSVFNLFHISGTMIMTFCICAFAVKRTEMNKNTMLKVDYMEHASMILFLFGGIGYGITVIWEPHHSDCFHKLLHYIGSIFILISPLALCLKESFSIISICLFTLTWLPFIVWYLIAVKTEVTSDDIVIVHKKTILLLSLELIGLFAQVLST
eukprot:275220_1